ncbi:unnamed protein product [Brachionus calyciflorus]|uniref:Uncharacterized protein n=1 Tax=Brachionus calyciflorus TaxID=104777 RepID=A0A813X4N8_9BILA|nr:unnamed protein product [Brachionus calyciflorus]
MVQSLGVLSGNTSEDTYAKIKTKSYTKLFITTNKLLKFEFLRKMNANTLNIKQYKTQILVFMLIYVFTCITTIGRGLGISYMINNLILLVISALPIIFIDRFQVYLTFAYACVISASIDLLHFSFLVLINHSNDEVYQSKTFFPCLVFGSIFMLVKIFISISELQISRFLADQPELKLKYSVDIFNHTKNTVYSTYKDEEVKISIDNSLGERFNSELEHEMKKMDSHTVPINS